MVNTAFSDFIVSATDLRKNQKRWFEAASRRPITINYGQQRLALINREEIHNLYVEKHYAELILRVCEEFAKEQKSNTFPWVEYLDDEDRKEFHRELLTCAIKSIITSDWTQLEYLIEDWKATAETEHSPEIVKALQDEGISPEYVTLE